MKKTTGYLKQEWEKTAAVDFVKIAAKKITRLASQPYIAPTLHYKIQKTYLQAGVIKTGFITELKIKS